MNIPFKALDDPKRRKILQILQEGDFSAGDIANKFSISKASILHHFWVLKNAGLIGSCHYGQFIRYSINTTVLEEAANWLLKVLSQE